MNQKIIETLEFKKVKQLLEPFVVTEQGRQQLLDLEPMDQAERIQQAFDEVTDMADLFVHYPHFSLSRTEDVAPAMRRLELEADLNIPELLSVKKVLEVSKYVADFYADLENVELPHLATLFEKIETFPQVQGSLQAINDAGFVEDFAGESLLKIRRKIQKSEQQVRQIMQDMLKTKADMLSDTVLASRNGRNVLPVKNTYRNRIAGVVHDISASGSTVYVEPRAVVALNEDMTNARAEERHEIVRILSALSDMLRPHTSIIRNNAWVLGRLDLVRTKHLFARQYNAEVPILSPDKDILLLNVRHPLLMHPVANDLRFGKDLTAIVITGPNTGGKTIMLKTLGLTHLMAQSGLPILANSGSRVAIFNQIFADISDEQSIEQSLSTFSSHMTHTVEILEKADADSLVLFDELGAGTDPQEGASLAMAILDDLRLRGIKTMATTHYPELKAYGIETPALENASMEFDTDSLRPTYRFMLGVPGRSNAFEIARRLGLSNVVIAAAQSFTDTDSDVNRVIDQLEKQTVESRRRLDNIREVEQDNLKMNRALKKLYNEFNREKENELNKARLEAQEIVDVALAESEEILKHLHDQATLKLHQIIEAKGQLKKLAPDVVDLSKNKVLKKAKQERAAKVGDDIVVTAYGQRGTLTNQLKDGRWEAQVGLIKMTLKREEFGLVKAEKESQPQQKQIHVVKRNQAKGPKARLDLRGKRYEEAMKELDEFIDQALLNNMAQVDIIHGIGTGVIRESVTKYLRRNKNVKEFGYAPQNAGGSGATIVTFK
ncbi:endonuclease MutS2 [Streptococcus sp. X16XC17]|uniref:endonuclease MutS2 n=1 Tax=unclassified Streptococcus TaxID=2608887 RepID=UPI00066FEABF|nr:MULTISPECIES: endonuclease MutS2 [unclassified Streptococcus]TCD45569.1 endonuclease MutS2 [Streptococcus sp. X16XC17]